MFRQLSQAPAQLPTSYGYIISGIAVVLLAVMLWRMTRFSAVRPK
jgi:hypothetical protein